MRYSTKSSRGPSRSPRRPKSMTHGRITAFVLMLGAAFAGFSSRASGQLVLHADVHELALTEGLAIDGTGRSGRRAINVDAVQALIVEGTLGAVKEGDKVA